MYKNVVKNTVLSVSLVALLVACGGSGSGGSSTKSITKEYDITPIDGYIFGAKICLDLNLNSTCDIDEPSTTSKTKDYKLVISKAEHLNHKNYNIAPLLSTGGIDIDTGKEFKGILESPKDSSKKINITPISTLVSKILSKELTTNASEDEIEKLIKAKENLVKKVLGIEDTNIDFIENKGTTDAKKANKVALQIQKISEALADANNNSGTTYKEELEKVLDTIATKIEGLKAENEDSKKLGVSALVDNTINALAPEDKKSNFKTLSSNIALIFDNMQKVANEDTSDLLDKINTLIEKEVEKIENDESIVAIEKDSKIFTTSKDEIRKLGIESKLKSLGVSGASSLATKLAKSTVPIVSAKNLFKIIDELIKTNSEFKEIKTAIDTYKEKQNTKKKEEKEREKVLGASKGLAPSEKLTLFNFYNYNNKYQYSKLDFKEKKLIMDYVYEFKNKSWEKENINYQYYILTSSGWKEETPTSSYTIDKNNVIYLSDVNGKLILVSKNDISNKTIHMKDLNLDVSMPSDAVSYSYKFINTNTHSYKLYNDGSHEYTSFTTLDDLITQANHCGTNKNKNDFGVGNTKYFFEKCTNGQTKGKLLSSNGSINGTWNITNVRGKDILMLKPNASFDDEFQHTIFTVFQKESGSLAVWKGEISPLKKFLIDTLYNDKARDAIKEKIKSHINHLKTKNSKFYALGHKWTNIKEHDKYESQFQVDGNNAYVSKGQIKINAYHANSLGSRADARVSFSKAKKEISAIVQLVKGSSGTRSNVAKGVVEASLENVGGGKGISFGINIKAKQISMYAWNNNADERLIPRSSEMVLINENVNINFLESTVQVKVTISVEGSKLTASVLPVINGVDNNDKLASKTFDLKEHFLSTEDKTLKINSAKIKAKIGQDVSDKNVQFKAMSFSSKNLD